MACLLILGACALPRGGPNKSEIFAGSVAREGNAHIVEVTDAVARAAHMDMSLGFSRAFRGAGQLGADTIRAGDTLGLTIWENVDDGLLASSGQKTTTLETIQVDGDGFIFVPFAGRVRAAGNSPEALRQIITNRLEEQTPDPQVEVRRLSGDGATVSVVGAIAAQGVYPIERSTRTLSSMIAKAGGVAIPPDRAQVVVTRGNMQGRVWFQDIFLAPQHDIALRAGDRIYVEADSRAYTAVGATGGQSRVEFQTHTLSAMEAMATVGGLSTMTADPTGIFVFRDETPKVASRMLGGAQVSSPQRFAYVLNLTKPNGMFIARDFQIRDGDTVYVTEAPFVQWSKILAAVGGTLGSVNTVTQSATTLGSL